MVTGTGDAGSDVTRSWRIRAGVWLSAILLVAGIGPCLGGAVGGRESGRSSYAPTGRVEAFVDGRRVVSAIYECRKHAGYMFLVPIGNHCLFSAVRVRNGRWKLRPRVFDSSCEDLAGDCGVPRGHSHSVKYLGSRGLAVDLGFDGQTIVLRWRSFVGKLEESDLLRDLWEYREAYHAYLPDEDVLRSVADVGKTPLELTLFVGAPWCRYSTEFATRVMRVVDAGRKLGLDWKISLVGVPRGGPRGLPEADAVGVVAVPALLVEGAGGEKWCIYYPRMERPENTLAGVLSGRIPPAADQQHPCWRAIPRAGAGEESGEAGRSSRHLFTK